jgi:hypothetical protein
LFVIVMEEETVHCAAKNARDATGWMDALNRQIAVFKHQTDAGIVEAPSASETPASLAHHCHGPSS